MRGERAAAPQYKPNGPLLLPPVSNARKRDREAPSASVVPRRSPPRGRRFCPEPTPPATGGGSSGKTPVFLKTSKFTSSPPLLGETARWHPTLASGHGPCRLRAAGGLVPQRTVTLTDPRAVGYVGAAQSGARRIGSKQSRAEQSVAPLSRAGAGRPAATAAAAPRGLPPSLQKQWGLPG